jgi:aldose 1-epimerase
MTVIVRTMLVAACLWAVLSPARAGITEMPWGRTADDGRPASLYTLINANGVEVAITSYGATIVSIRLPAKDGSKVNVVQGFDSLTDYTSADYIAANGHYGTTVGRFANRIRGAEIVLDGQTYRLDPDKNGDLDQGGRMAYFRQVFHGVARDGAEPSLVLTHTDPDGFMGFPGKVEVTVTYTLTRNNVLRIDFAATTDKKTVINIINHSYFNLAGSGLMDGETLQLFAHAYTPIDEHSIPTGEIRNVKGTDFDFTAPQLLGPRMNSAVPEISSKKGLDHNFVIDGPPGKLRIAARLKDPSGRMLEVYTTQPGVQVYSANSVRPKVAKGKGYRPHSAISFQTQHYPDSPHHPNFPTTVVTPDRPFHEITELRFSTERR